MTPYGSVEAQTGSEGETRFDFTGHERDFGTGLVYAGARYLDTEAGRWLSVDPYADDYPGWSPYNYALDNPLGLNDPTGNCPEGVQHGETWTDPGFGEMVCYNEGIDEGAVVEGEDQSDRYTVMEYGWLDRILGLGEERYPSEWVYADEKWYYTYPNDAAEVLVGVLDAPIGPGGPLRIARSLLKPGGKLIGKAGSKPTYRVVAGSLKDAKKLFQKLSQGGAAVTGGTYPGTLVQLPGGGTVGLRTFSTKSGPNTIATVDVNIPGLSEVKKVKFVK